MLFKSVRTGTYIGTKFRGVKVNLKTKEIRMPETIASDYYDNFCVERK